MSEKKSGLFGESCPLRHIEQRVQPAAKVFTQAERVEEFNITLCQQNKAETVGILPVFDT